jgi:hypothetical protein
MAVFCAGAAGAVAAAGTGITVDVAVGAETGTAACGIWIGFVLALGLRIASRLLKISSRVLPLIVSVNMVLPP